MIKKKFRHSHNFVFSFKGLKYDGTEFTAYLPRNTYLYNQLVKAYKAGYTFKLEKIPSMPGRGRIVWGDIPHKTKASGGRER